MKPSKYNITYPTADGGVVIYNTLYGSMTQLDAAEKESVLATLNSTVTTDATGIEGLIKQKHLIADDVDEYDIVNNRRKAGIESKGRLDLVVMPTLDCNFDCVYCFEERQQGSRMTPDVEERLIKWLEREVPSARMTLLHWYGGEPLFDAPLICRVSKKCQQIASDNNGLLALHMTTNGYLLCDERLDLLLDAGVKYYQVTVDGPRKTHDKMRPLRGGLPSFDKIVQNVIGALNADPQVRMTLRVNMNHTNINEVTELFECFPQQLRSRLSLAVEPIFGDECVSATDNMDRHYISEKLAQIYEIAEKHGYGTSVSKTLLLTGRRIYCYAERDRQFIFGPTGALFKCAAHSFCEEDRVGMLSADGIIEEYENRCKEWASYGNDFTKECKECVYLPLCMGGCRRVRVTEEDKSCTLIPTNAAYILKQIALTGNVSAAMKNALVDGRAG